MAKKVYAPKLAAVASLEEAAYNPRKQIPERMELLRLSLMKLGFVLPLYATDSGHLLSGHQRLDTARKLGCVHVPVATATLDDGLLKAFNLVFNRATNDMLPGETAENLFEHLKLQDIDRIVNSLPDRDPMSPEFFRCMNPALVPVEDLLAMTTRDYDAASIAMARKLIKAGVVMPVVAVRGGNMINGNYRAFAAVDLFREGDKSLAKYPVVWIEPEEEEAARLLVNMVSMQFTVEDQHADYLRYGSFRRARLVSENLTRAFRFWADKERPLSAAQSLANPQEFWGRWRAIHGATVLDFGAGQRRNTTLLRQKGVECIDFEPYAVPWDQQGDENKQEPSLELSRRVVDHFLSRLDDGVVFSSIFMNAILNSVPFHADRMKVLAIVHACCSFGTVLYGTTTAAATLSNRLGAVTNDVSQDGRRLSAPGPFELPYEDNIVIAEVGTRPKVQKYMHPHEIRSMLEVFWKKVDVWENVSGYLAFRASAPKRVNPGALARALDFEFNLPYPDDQSLDRQTQARDVFSRRLNIELP